MRNVLNNGKQLVGWGFALIFFGSLCIYTNAGTFVALVGAFSLVMGLLLSIAGSIISTTAASPRKAALFGGGATVVGAITSGIMLLFRNPSVHGAEMPPIFVVIPLTTLSLLICLVGLLRLTLNRRTRRVG